MRNSFKYSDFDKDDLLIALLDKSVDTDYVSVMSSSFSDRKTNLPRDYINYDLIAGVGAKETIISNKDSFEKLYNFHSNKKDWLFGYLSYDLKNEKEQLTSKNSDNLSADNLHFFIPEYVFFLRNGKLEVQTENERYVCDKFIKSFNFFGFPSNRINVNFIQRDNKSAYLNKIEKIKEHIQRGDIYEMNYCQEFYAKETEILAEDVFLKLNNSMKAPFSSFLKLKDKYVLSASPERFLRKKANQVLTQPIKGTRKRGLTDEEDAILINNLKKSQKDISENIMITDLVRNDLSVTAKKKSVIVDELCEIYTFEKVHQMITTVSSEIDDSIKFTDVIKSAFPMGSMTGAPKLKAMELIEYFEEFKRGIFSGAVGYITPEADFDFNVVIRTILYNLANKYLSIGVGGAITIKSEPEEEYEECLIKAKPLFEVLNFDIDD